MALTIASFATTLFAPFTKATGDKLDAILAKLNAGAGPPAPPPAPAIPVVSIVATGPVQAEGASTFSFVLIRTGDLTQGSHGFYRVSGVGPNPAAADDFVGGAFPDDDWRFAAGQAQVMLAIPVAPDSAVEADEGFQVTLYNPEGCTFGNTVAAARILNDDALSPPPPPPIPPTPTGGFTWPTKGATLDISSLVPAYAPTFSGVLDEYHRTANPTGEHRTNYAYGSAGDVMTGLYPGPWDDKATSRTNAKEQQVYGGVRYAPELGSPFKIVNGQLEISAFVNPDPANPKAINSDTGQVAKYVSGLINSLPRFSQTYGYFESTVLLPSNGLKGLWPAGVLYGMPTFKYPEPSPTFTWDELDIFEHLSGEQGGRVLHFNAHVPRIGWNMPEVTVTFDPTKPVTVGLLWTKETIGWFVDRKEVASVANPANGFHQPMFWMHNLAVGPNDAGGWAALNMPADPRAFPGKMIVQKKAAYRLA